MPDFIVTNRAGKFQTCAIQVVILSNFGRLIEYPKNKDKKHYSGF